MSLSSAPLNEYPFLWIGWKGQCPTKDLIFTLSGEELTQESPDVNMELHI